MATVGSSLAVLERMQEFPPEVLALMSNSQYFQEQIFALKLTAERALQNRDALREKFPDLEEIVKRISGKEFIKVYYRRGDANSFISGIDGIIRTTDHQIFRVVLNTYKSPIFRQEPGWFVQRHDRPGVFDLVDWGNSERWVGLPPSDPDFGPSIAYVLSELVVDFAVNKASGSYMQILGRIPDSET